MRACVSTSHFLFSIQIIEIDFFLIRRADDWSTWVDIAQQKGLNLPLLVFDWHLHILSHVLGGVLAVRPKYRMQFQAYLAARSEGMAAAASVSALLGNRDMKEVMAISQQHFRKVQLKNIKHEDMMKSDPDPELYFASEAAVLGDVDVFLSHSWHDSAQLKWDALQAWRAKFFKNHGREPVGRDEQTQGLSVSMFFAVA